MRSSSLATVALRALRALALTFAFLPLSLALAGTGGGKSPARPSSPVKPNSPAKPGSPAASSDVEKQAVTAAVERYFQGHATGDGELWRQAFHPEAKLFWVKGGALQQKTAADFAAGAPGKPAADEARRVRRILSLDTAGDAAMVKVELVYPEVTFIDYLSLLKIDGQWRIVNKIFHRKDPAPSGSAALPSRP